MAKNPHCKKCGDEILNKDNAIKKANYYYCKKCGEKIEKNKEDYKELYNYICELYQIDELTGMMLKQIKSFKEEYNYEYKGMYLSLVYFYDLFSNTVKDNTGLGIIPYVYNDAKQFYINQIKVAKSLQKLNEPLVEDVVINIKKTVSKPIKTNLKLIDINEL